MSPAEILLVRKHLWKYKHVGLIELVWLFPLEKWRADSSPFLFQLLAVKLFLLLILSLLSCQSLPTFRHSCIAGTSKQSAISRRWMAGRKRAWLDQWLHLSRLGCLKYKSWGPLPLCKIYAAVLFNLTFVSFSSERKEHTSRGKKEPFMTTWQKWFFFF